MPIRNPLRTGFATASKASTAKSVGNTSKRVSSIGPTSIPPIAYVQAPSKWRVRMSMRSRRKKMIASAIRASLTNNQGFKRELLETLVGLFE